MPGKANEGVPRPAVPPLQAPVLPSHQCSLVDVAFEVLQLLTLWDGDHLLNLLQLRVLGASGLHGCQDGFHPLRLLQQPPRGEGSDGQENGGFRPPPPWPNPPPCPRDSSSPALTCSPWSHIDAVQSGWPHSGKRKEKQGQGEPPPHTPWGGGTVGGRYPCSDSRTKTGGEMLGWPNSRPRSCVVVVENHTQWWWWRTMCGGGEPCVVVENHAWWWWWRATGLHHPEQEHAWGSWISPPAWKYLCGWRPCGDLTGIRVVPLAFGDGQTKQNHQQVCGSIHVGDWDLPCSICAAASVRRTGCSRCRGRRCGMVRGQESWESPTRGQEKGGGLHHAACPCGDLHGVGD